MAEVRLLTFGRLRCHAGGRALDELPAQRLRCAVLLYLAVEREVTREAAASLLWPERTDERARHALSQKLYELRQLLGDDWLDAQGQRLRITDRVRLDVHEFENALARGELEAALGHYTGEFLFDFFVPESKSFENWIDSHRSRLARLHREKRRELIDLCSARGDLTSAVDLARTWVELEPLEDQAQYRLIDLLGRRGERAEAIRQYDRYTRTLAAEELEPLGATRDLIARIRQSSTGFEAAPEQRLPGAVARPVQQPRRWRFLLFASVAVLATVAAAAMAAGTRAWLGTDEARAIAVLPFLNLSTDRAASEYISDGIADELINALGQTAGLQVAARTSSFRFKNRNVSVRAIGDSLGVDVVLEGSIKQSADRLRVTAQLVKVRSGYRLWSSSFDRELTDAIAVQQEIAGAIADALKLRLSDPARARLASGATSDPRAYDWFLRGRYLLHKGTRQVIRSAIVAFDSPIAHDSTYALAYANQAEAYVIAAAIRELPHSDALRAAAAAAKRAVQLEPRLSEARSALGRAELELWNWAAAEREAVLAIRLNERNAPARALYARVLMVRGRIRNAVREAGLAMRLEPLSPIVANTYGEALRAAGSYPAAARVYRNALVLEPNLGRQNLAKVFVELGQYDSAMAYFRTAAATGAPRLPNAPVLWAAYVRARAGDRAEAMRLVQQFQDRTPRGPNAYMLAALYLALGHYDRAFDLAETGVDDRNQAAWRQLPWDPVWDPVRQHPRFRQLLRQMGL